MATRQDYQTNGLVFEDQVAVVASDPNRTDVALFVGFVARRPGVPLPATIADWLVSQGWTSPDYGRLPIADLLDVPVPVDNWQIFDQLFAWDQRPLFDTPAGPPAPDDEAPRGEPPAMATTLLGAAVRSFFVQGGRKCYVVRAGDPLPVIGTTRDERTARIDRLVPGYPFAFAGSPADPANWHGMAHLLGLPDASFLCMPDLVECVSGDQQPPEPAHLPPAALEVFTECSDDEPPPVKQLLAQRIQAPRCDDQGYADWGRALGLAGGALARYAREVQLVAALPIPQAGQAAEAGLLAYLTGDDPGLLNALPLAGANSFASAFVQVVYPWVRTYGSANLAEGLESPDAVLAGLLARNSLERGTFRSAAGRDVPDVYDLYPALSHEQMYRPDSGQSSACACLLDRVSLFGFTPGGLRLLSDVTTSLDQSYRPAGLNRLMSVIVRAARRLGEELTFESSGERLWERLRDNLDRLLLALLQAGALRGTSPADAYSVRCDRSTMTQNDIDAGRLIAEIQFDPVAPVDTITVVLALNEGGQVSLRATNGAGAG